MFARKQRGAKSGKGCPSKAGARNGVEPDYAEIKKRWRFIFSSHTTLFPLLVHRHTPYYMNLLPFSLSLTWEDVVTRRGTVHHGKQSLASTGASFSFHPAAVTKVGW